VLGFLEVNSVVEIEVRKSEPGTEKVESTNLDVNEVISKVRSFADSLRSMSSGGKHMSVSVEGFHFSVGKTGGTYDLTLKLNLVFKPKESAEA
jgi:hypothetical protein